MIFFDSSVAAISAAGDFSGSGFDPNQTDSITSPVTLLARPRAIVSTSGSSGMGIVYRLESPSLGLGIRLTGFNDSIAHGNPGGLLLLVISSLLFIPVI